MRKDSYLPWALFLAAVIVTGCATHSPIQQPNLDADMHAQMTRQTVDGVMVMARPVHAKSELKSYFDEDLVLYGVLPFHVGFKNLDGGSCRIEVQSAALAAPDGSLLPPMSLEQVYGKASKSYARTIGWGAAFGLLGAIPSAINVAVVNDKIKADYERCLLKDGELVAGGYTEGSIFFPIDKNIESLDGWQLILGFEKQGGRREVHFALSGRVEQPRVPKDRNRQE